MRIEDTGRYEWRKELYTDAADALGESTKSKGIDASCEFTRDMLTKNLPEALEHEDMTPELAEILSTRTIRLKYEIETGIERGE